MQGDDGGTADEVQRTETGGVLVLHGNDEYARKVAADLAIEHCGPKGFQIVKEEPGHVGDERFIHYQCRN